MQEKTRERIDFAGGILYTCNTLKGAYIFLKKQSDDAERILEGILERIDFISKDAESLIFTENLKQLNGRKYELKIEIENENENEKSTELEGL